MQRTRHIPSATRAAGFWLVMLSVLLGPFGVGRSLEAASQKTCGVSCPCDEEQHAEHDEVESGCSDDGCDTGHLEEAPCNDECPDSCSECGCCPGLAAGIVPNVAPTAHRNASSSDVIVSPDAALTGALSGVFRPPRSLT